MVSSYITGSKVIESAHCESLRKTMIFALGNPWRIPAKVHLQILANPCESLRKHELLKLAKACETLHNHTFEFAGSLLKHAKSHWRKLTKWSISAKAYLRNLAKIHAFCTCESLRKHYLQNLVKVYLSWLTAPPLLLAHHRTSLLNLVLLSY